MVQFSPSADPQGFVPSSAGAVPGRLTLMALSVLLSGMAFAQVPAPAPAGFGEAPIVGQLAQASPPPAGMAAPGHGPRMAVPGAPGAHAGPGMQRPGAGPAGHHGGPGMHRRGMGAAGPVMMLLGPGQDRALELVKATPQQRADIRRIAGAARDDLRKTRQDGRPGLPAGPDGRTARCCRQAHGAGDGGYRRRSATGTAALAGRALGASRRAPPRRVHGSG